MDWGIQQTDMDEIGAENVPHSSMIGRRLIEAGLIAEADLKTAASIQNRIGGKIGAILIRIGAVSEETLLQVLSTEMRFPVADPDDLPSDPKVYLDAIEESGIVLDWYLDQDALIWLTPSGEVKCIARDPFDGTIGEVLNFVFPDRKVVFCLIRNYDLERELETVSRVGAMASPANHDINQLREIAQEAPIIELVNNLLSQAFDQAASDIHLEPGDHQFKVRFRIDGMLHTRFSVPKDRFAAVTSRIKLISGLDIAERRLPQDGHLSTRLSGNLVDIRVSTVPGVYGESVVLRLLPKEGRNLYLDQLGLEPDSLNRFVEWINSSHGIILVTGPTGSGKTTTLYAALEAINDHQKKIITVEDPVEYPLEDITQIQVHSEIGYSFARALRSILRQDPDIILIGEIRDKETAEIAIQASLTGHLVMSTLHTNDAVSAFTRLIDMGVEPFMVVAAVRAVIAQRLLRRLCEACAEPSKPIEGVNPINQSSHPKGTLEATPRWRAPRGCGQCQEVGYRGREGIFELIEITPVLQDMILKNRSAGEIRRQAIQDGFQTLREHGMLKARRGITSIEEVLRVTSE